MSARRLYNALVCNRSGRVSSKDFLGFLSRNGLVADDPRLATTYKYLTSINAVEADVELTMEQFTEAIAHNSTLVHKCVSGELRIPDFTHFCNIIEEVYKEVLPNTSGANASYIPQLAEVDPDQFAISVTTVDGQHFSVGDANTQFCIQSCSKPISYLMALKKFGTEYVHRHVGTEASGQKFNQMVLKDAAEEGAPNRKIPHNPCINAGAIMAVSMVRPELASRKERHEEVLSVWKELSGGDDAPIGYDDATYKSESATADRNWCLGYMMKESQAFPPCFTDLGETLELYFQICSTLSTCRAMANMAATLANGGLNPITGVRTFEADHVRCALPIMHVAGMYDFSGQWAFDIGFPAKSGVGGCVFAVIPNVCGISIWSPRLDSVGNSVRGVAVCQALVRRFQFHNFEVFSGLSSKKIDVTSRKNANFARVNSVLFSASLGDVQALKMMDAAGIDLFVADYDSRTALHLAASEGHDSAVKMLLEAASKKANAAALISARDRWGGTALSNAVAAKSESCAELLRNHGASEGVTDFPHDDSPFPGVISEDAPSVLTAAADGDVDELIKLSMEYDLGIADYDRRTGLHLAASNGHADAVNYILIQAGENAKNFCMAKDRFGNTPLDDARREHHDACGALIETFMK